MDIVYKLDRIKNSIGNLDTLYQAHNGGKNYLKVPKWDVPEAIKVILDNTKYVDFKTMENTIRKVVQLSLNAIGGKEYYIIVYSTEILDSSWLMLLMAWDIIRKSNLQGIYTYTTAPKDATLLSIDDALYSGGNTMGMLEDLAEHQGKIHIVLGYSTSNLTEVVNQYPQLDITFHIGQMVPLYNEIAPVPLEDIYPEYDLSGHKAMLYFDHKLASDASTYKDIYLGWCPVGEGKYEKRWDEMVSVTRSIIYTLKYLYLLY
jgi:hypothetical protein